MAAKAGFVKALRFANAKGYQVDDATLIKKLYPIDYVFSGRFASGFRSQDPRGEVMRFSLRPRRAVMHLAIRTREDKVQFNQRSRYRH